MGYQACNVRLGNKAVSGARSGHVGVGGYPLGGTKKPTSNQIHASKLFTEGKDYSVSHGFSCDNVAAYEIVLANVPA